MPPVYVCRSHSREFFLVYKNLLLSLARTFQLYFRFRRAQSFPNRSVLGNLSFPNFFRRPFPSPSLFSVAVAFNLCFTTSRCRPLRPPRRDLFGEPSPVSLRHWGANLEPFLTLSLFYSVVLHIRSLSIFENDFMSMIDGSSLLLFYHYSCHVTLPYKRGTSNSFWVLRSRFPTGKELVRGSR